LASSSLLLLPSPLFLLFFGHLSLKLEHVLALFLKLLLLLKPGPLIQTRIILLSYHQITLLVFGFE
jgi:hypothetical protein